MGAADAADDKRQERMDGLDRESARLRTRLSRILEEEIDAPSGSETARMLRAKRAQIETALVGLESERESIERAPTFGLTTDQAAALKAHAADIGRGAQTADATARRAVIRPLRLRGTVRLDTEHGVRLGRLHRFSIDWESVIPLVGPGQEFVNVKTIVISGEKGSVVTRVGTE